MGGQSGAQLTGNSLGPVAEPAFRVAPATEPSTIDRVSAGFRRRRGLLLRQLIGNLKRQHGAGTLRILDVGGSLNYWSSIGFDFLHEHRVHLTIVNKEAGEFKPTPLFGDVEYLIGDARQLDLENDSFDFVHSNSVVEHVGGYRDMMSFAGEIRRLAPAYYVQTPYFWFPVDPHFYRLPAVHWLPAPLQMALMRRFGLGYSGPGGTPDQAASLFESRNLLDRRQFQYLFPDARHCFEWFAGLPKSMIATRSSAI